MTFAKEQSPILLLFNLVVEERLGSSYFGSVDRIDRAPFAMPKIREYLKSLTCICEKSSGRPPAMYPLNDKNATINKSGLLCHF